MFRNIQVFLPSAQIFCGWKPSDLQYREKVLNQCNKHFRCPKFTFPKLKNNLHLKKQQHLYDSKESNIYYVRKHFLAKKMGLLGTVADFLRGSVKLAVRLLFHFPFKEQKLRSPQGSIDFVYLITVYCKFTVFKVESLNAIIF